MNWTEETTNLRFQTRRSVPYRVIAVGAILAIFILLWVVVANSVFYWLGLFLVGVLTWMATYGWREWVAVMIRILRRLEQL